MDAPRTILVPVDLSARSLLGLDYGAMLARETGASLLLFCNVNLPERAALEALAESEGATLDEAGESQLRRFAHARAPEVSVKVVIGYDESPAQGILEVAEDMKVDLIVLASHGRTGVSRLLLGSIAEKIARLADVPVMIVPARMAEDEL